MLLATATPSPPSRRSPAVLLSLLFGCAVPPPPLDLEAGSSDGSPPSTSTSMGTTTTEPMSTTGVATSSGPTASTSTSMPGLPEESSTSVPSESTTAVDSLGMEDTETSAALTAGSSGTTGIACAMDLVECNAECIDPLTDFDFCGAQDPCDVDPGVDCVDNDELCVTGACSPCELKNDFNIGMEMMGIFEVGSTASWITNDWTYHAGAPLVPMNAAVSFPDPAYGINLTGDIVEIPGIYLGDTLRFRSWHVDRGGDTASGWDNKIISVNKGTGWTEIVNCFTNAGGSAALPLCQWHSGPRSGDDWDLIVLDTSMWNGLAQLRFSYENVTGLMGFEQGWYIDDLRAGDCGPPTL